jgi:hypothetical protein
MADAEQPNTWASDGQIEERYKNAMREVELKKWLNIVGALSLEHGKQISPWLPFAAHVACQAKYS